MDLKPSPLDSAVFEALVERFGEPGWRARFDAGGSASAAPPVLDLFVWAPDAAADVTHFATVGMCDRAIPQAPYRAEIHLSRRGAVTEEERDAIAAFLAGLAAYPFVSGRPVDWWHTLGGTGAVPGFGTCSAVLFHPAFVIGGFDRLVHDGVEVRILNAVPITDEERTTAERLGVPTLLERMHADGVDFLSGR